MGCAVPLLLIVVVNLLITSADTAKASAGVAASAEAIATMVAT